MKPTWIAVIIIGILLGFSICMDILMGIAVKDALDNAFNPFRVMEFVEFSILTLLVAVLFLKPLVQWIFKKYKPFFTNK
ncbi:hypothetical protein [Pseudalkalibacillus salsuginis]|uniref:hypothetical protein n=1 Tax=Pseudalkalibacillus salsuginis TaxID=2910972 RepID=UPI001F4824CB|nr:hypothetical protein [Pseudalkalibacillus salsuginis]MCF6410306.1 hypothetical protein [Pseudalkalibacillus salsuginis]